LMEAGVEVCLVGTKARGAADHPGVMDVAEEFQKKGYSCHGVAANLSSLEAGEECFTKCLDTLGGDVDILVVAHGIQRRHPSNEFPAKDWHDVIGTNLDSVFGIARPAADLFKNKGYGKIILIASMCSWFGGKTVPAYSAAKGGVAQLTKGMSNDLIGYGVNVNAIAPGYMATDMNKALLDLDNPRYQQLTDRIPAHRWGTGQDMKGCCIFLASHASDYLGGAVIPVDGGYLVM
ncbi:MAG: SDR family oxidoreductase, partial [Peptoniphilaceae bacterium]|nr:SDR family oxidoreductase [Peptoniphilaceae bacterium]